MMWRLLVVSSLWLALGSVVQAQADTARDTPPPKGPAEIIQRSAAARKAREAANLVESPGNHPSPDSPGPGPDGVATPGQQPSAAPAGQSPAAAKPGQPPSAAPAAQQPSAADSTAAPGELPAGHPTVAGGAAEDTSQAPVGDDPHQGMDGAPALARRPLALAEPSVSLPPGSVRVQVLDANDKLVSGATVQLGTMTQQSGRTAIEGRTDNEGAYTFEKQPTGDKQAYRVNVLYQGAKYSTTPFRLPTDHGFDVAIRRLDTTSDPKELVLYVGATSVELKDERLKVVQQARLINIGSKTYVFPEKGQLVKLPKGAMAFQAEEIMTDQHVKEAPGEGLRVTGRCRRVK
jgi:hypothetical protein